MAPRVAVVTGGSSGIGAALARALGARDWRCVLLARRETRLREVAAQCGGEFEVCDVADRDAVETVARRILERHPAIGLLVNNAGIPGHRGYLDIEPEQLERVLRTNYLGSVWCLRAFLPGLEAADGAHVVNVVSVAGAVAWPASGPYSASKHAQLAFSRSVAAELRQRGITVHTINPGFVETEGFPQRTTLRASLLRRTVLKPDAVARHIVRMLERRATETFVPSWYRAAAVAQALAPGLLARVVPASRYMGSEK